jgi:sugar lactone lactonase YvrE
MRYIRLVVCAGMLLAMSGVASAQQDYINTFAGGGPNNVPATSANANAPGAVVLDGAGNIYYTSGNRVFKVNGSTRILTVFAGNGFAGYSGDGGPATDAEEDGSGIAFDSQGNLFIADSGNCLIRKVNANTGFISTIAGITPPNRPSTCQFSGDGGPATSANLDTPVGVAIDRNGNLLVSDSWNNRIRVVACATVNSGGGACSPNSGQTIGNIYTVAGGGADYNDDGILATSAGLFQPQGITTDNSGNLYIADTEGFRIRRVACGTGISGCTPPLGETSGYIYTVAGNGMIGYTGDGIAATAAEFNTPVDVLVDNSGNLFIADQKNNRIRMVTCATVMSSGSPCTPNSGQTTGDIYTVAGDGSSGFNGDNQSAGLASLFAPAGIAVDSTGDLFIADLGNYRVREVPCQIGNVICTPPSGDSAGFIYTVAGNGLSNFSGNNVPATDAALAGPSGTHSDSAGNIYIADAFNCIVQIVSANTGMISTFAGTPGTCGYGGDGGSATSAYLNQPAKVYVDSSDNVYIADAINCLVREVSNGTITTIAGNHSLGCGYSGDGGAATNAKLSTPHGVTVDGSGNLYIADKYNHRIRKVSGGIISTFAGNGIRGYSGDGRPATEVELADPDDVVTDGAGNVYIADSERVRKVVTSGIISTYAGNGQVGYEGDGVLATKTSIGPQGLAIDAAGDVLIADVNNSRIRLVDGLGIIHTIAGDGAVGFLGQGVPATTAEFYFPLDICLDSSGNIYVADLNNSLVRKINVLAILGPSLASVPFGMQAIHTTSAPVALTLTSAGPVTISSITASANFHETDDCPGSLPIGSSCTVKITFAPTAAGVLKGALSINYNGFLGPTESIGLTGTGTNYEIFGRTFITFPTQVVNTTSANTKVTFKYTGTGTLTLNSLTPSANFAVNTTGISSGACNLSGTTSLAQFGSCAFNVAFSPTSVGTINGNVTASFSGDPGGNTSVQLPLTGTATEVTLSPTALAFGTVASGMKNETLTVTNKGATALTFSGTPSISGTGAGQFKVLPNTGGNSTCLSGTPVAQNGTCTFTVQFTSTGGGILYSETMSISDNGGASPQTVKITAKD